MVLFSKWYLCIENGQHIMYLRLLTCSSHCWFCCRWCHCRTKILKYQSGLITLCLIFLIYFSIKYLFKVLISGSSCILYYLKLNLIDCCFIISIICKFTNNKPACRWTRWHCNRPMKRSINCQKRIHWIGFANDGCCGTDNVQSFWVCPHHELLHITPLLVQ